MTEREKMVRGELYRGDDPQLVRDRAQATRLFQAYNRTGPNRTGKRRRLLTRLFAVGGAGAIIVPPFFCDYGYNIRVGKNFYANFGCIMLDVSAITIGDDVLLAPGVQLLSATHPVEPGPRRALLEYGRPITIGDGVWIGGGAIVCPGVTIGENTVIGAGSVVTRDIPAGVVAAGNPCRVIREVREGG
jgi:maltose O-acetyltransferase